MILHQVQRKLYLHWSAVWQVQQQLSMHSAYGNTLVDTPPPKLQGYVAPEVEPGTAAAVFAVYDQHQKLQYIGFSKDLRSSLKTVLGRRPDKAFFFK